MTYRFFTKTWHSVALVALVAMSLVAFGCGTKNDSSSITNPNPNNLNPTGSLQGVLTDSTTGQPIVGAVIDIGVATATTNDKGLYTFWNIPATSNADGFSGGGYVGTIDLRNVTSPINQQTTTGYKYPPTVFYSADVVFSSFDDTNASNPGGGSGSNHDTPITGLMATANFSIGKLASNLNVLVVNGIKVDGICVPTPIVTPVGPTFVGTVNLLLSSNGGFGGMQQDGSYEGGGLVIVDSKPIVDSRASFTRVMSHAYYLASAFDANKTVWGDKSYFTPADNQTLMTMEQAETGSDFLTGPPVAVCSTDTRQPQIAGTVPGQKADIPDNTELVYLINFTEPIANTTAPLGSTYTSSTTPGTGGLYNDVLVNFVSAKAGNIVHQIAWNSPTQLAITFPPLAPSSKYSVVLNCNAKKNLKDLKGNPIVGAGVTCEDSFDFKREFTTSTTYTAEAASNVEVVNRAVINNSAVTVNLDWPPAPGAFGYSIYRSKVVVLGGYAGTEAPGPYERIFNNTASSQYDDTTAGAYTDGQNQVFYRYQVVSLNTDKNEAATSSPVDAIDVVRPALSAPNNAFRASYIDGNDTLDVVFNEPVDEDSAEVAANYTVRGWNGTTPVTISPSPKPFMKADLRTVTLTLSAAMDNNTNFSLTDPKVFNPFTVPAILAGSNGVCNSTIGTLDYPIIPTNQGSPDNCVCVAPGTDNVLASAVGGDDTPNTDNTIRAGANGVCQSTAVGNDVQGIAVGVGCSSTAVCAHAAADMKFNTAANGCPSFPGEACTVLSTTNDVIVYPAVVTVTGVLDIAGNPINTTGDEIGTDGPAR